MTMDDLELFPAERTTFPLVITTFHGLERVLAGEVMRLGGLDVEEHMRAVTLTGDRKMLYAANYHLRTALRVLRVVARCRAGDAGELYRAAREVEWERFFSNGQRFLVETAVRSPHFRNSMFVAQRVKDAVADRFRDKTGMRPSVDRKNPEIRIHVRISGKSCVLSLDSSGEPLFRRGYRVRQGVAALNEVLAAGMILLSGWHGDTPFLDPMCGSGTLPIEAALFALDIPPGYLRQRYAFIKWKDYDAGLYQSVKTQYASPRKRTPAPVIGSDRSAVAIRLARLNVTQAGLEEQIKLMILPVEEMTPPAGPPGIIVTDPPYGKRMRPADLRNIYRNLGQSLMNNFPGYTAWILSNDERSFRWLGMQHTASFELNHGGLHVTLRKFPLRRSENPPKKIVRQKK